MRSQPAFSRMTAAGSMVGSAAAAAAAPGPRVGLSRVEEDIETAAIPSVRGGATIGSKRPLPSSADVGSGSIFNPLLPKTPAAARRPRKGEVVIGYSANGSPLGAIVPAAAANAASAAAATAASAAAVRPAPTAAAMPAASAAVHADAVASAIQALEAQLAALRAQAAAAASAAVAEPAVAAAPARSAPTSAAPKAASRSATQQPHQQPRR